ncbi:MAG: tagaturonate reductase [Cyclobacteriaceae bacterium]|nr:tagaturonate reductase [Cyclobacteriaceae bacterium]
MLRELNASTAGKPQRPVRILQFGEGNFLRAFADWMVDILNEKTGFNGNIQIVQPLPDGMTDALNKQDCLYHVTLNGILQGKTFSDTRLITSINGAINPYENPAAFFEQAENPELQFVISNTTESGIAFDVTDSHSATLAKSFPGKVTQLLWHRYNHFNGAADKGLYFLPCELIEKNADTLRTTIHQYIELWNLPADFKLWVNEHNVFCNTLVDRIVPGFPKDTIDTIQKELDYKDNLVVTAEPFHLWVIEAPEAVSKAFPADKAGLDVKFVSDLTPYRTRKVRILNGAHTALVPVAYLRGLRTVKESVDDTITGKFIREAIFNEIVPTLELPARELNQFAHDVIERFQNPFIRHELASIALNSVSKFKVRVLPSLLTYYNQTGTLPERLVLSLTALILFYKGEWNGASTPLNDALEVIEHFKNAWNESSLEKTMHLILSNTDFWGTDLTRVKGLTNHIVNQVKSQSIMALPVA